MVAFEPRLLTWPSSSDWVFTFDVLELSPEKLMTRFPSNHTSVVPVVVVKICVRHSITCQVSAESAVVAVPSTVPVMFGPRRMRSSPSLPRYVSVVCTPAYLGSDGLLRIRLGPN